MSFLSEFRLSLAGGGLLHRLCRSSGFPIRTDLGQSVVIDLPGLPSARWHLTVTGVKGHPVMGFTARGEASLPARSMPKGLPIGLLERNHGLLFGSWTFDEYGDSYDLRMEYTALTAGVDAATFRRIVSTMATEVAEIDAELRERGVV